MLRGAMPLTREECHVDDDIRHAHDSAGRLAAHTLHFAPVLDSGWCDAIGGELRWLLSAVGPAHDLEILNQIISACAAAMPTGDAGDRT